MSASANDTIDLQAIFKKLLSKWWVFFITCALAIGGGVAYIKTTAKIYLVKTVVMMSEKDKSAMGSKEEFLKGSALMNNSSAIEDLIAQLVSVSNVTKTMQRLEFGIAYYERKDFLTQQKFEYPPFFVKLDTVAIQVFGLPIHVKVDREAGTYRVQAEAKHAQLYNVQKQIELEGFIADYKVDEVRKIGEPFVAEGLSFTIEFPEDRNYGNDKERYFTINSLDALVAEYRDKTTAGALSEESNIVEVMTTGEVTAKEKQYLNKLVETFIESELLRRQRKGRSTINFIDEQIGVVSDSLRKSQESVEKIRKQDGVFDVGQSVDVILNDRSRLEDERSQWVRKRQYCVSILSKLRTNTDYRNVPAPQSSGIDDAVLNSTVLELTKLSADLAAENMNTVKSNPKIVTMERRIRNLVGSLISTAEGLVEQADITIADLSKRLGTLNFRMNKMGSTEGSISSAALTSELTGDLYNYLMEKKYEASIAVASDQVDKYVIDIARNASGKPIKPAKKMVFGTALMLGLLLPLGFLLIRDFFNDSIENLDQLKRVSSIPVLATIPSSKRKRIMPDEPKSLLAESFRTARINLQYLNTGKQRQVVGFTSSTSGEGKTFCAVNLATVMALSGKSTIMVDADMRRPRLTETLGLTEENKGLSTYLIGEARLDEIIRKTDIQGMDMISAGPVPPNPLELVELPKMEELFIELRKRYDNIIVDASPMGLVSEYVIISRHTDVTLYVVRERYTKRGALRLINEMVKGKKMTDIDLLFNDVEQASGDGYGYYTK
ncbi:MAG: polysaccharide biosynthesis tyrosine autokinase [Flavobacteriales bacterium]|nr:polysaccharide biosynthesis tyrosine autokinase [Flavobacteriales bacterium]MBK7238574.1 polysaccharide biosynthesis tyrosine autokinase [Flavobacteriales bacterium]MBP9137420.1 polysaccharide biosynthesis tyrosine autokinase [Flavobacteriales bacterium]HQV50764.1 polysaccharide biosynthesis tyrosine autokinase [Flavobacteriales bacterium]HQX28672.1 polysaccharide biosynthesis tyrosine autokinase [Flavobacteriales bacterium]